MRKSNELIPATREIACSSGADALSHTKNNNPIFFYILYWYGAKEGTLATTETKLTRMIYMRVVLFCWNIFLITSAQINAQRQERGSSPTNPWKEEIIHGVVPGGKPDSIFYTELKFGSWFFKAVYGNPVIMNVTDYTKEQPAGKIGKLLDPDDLIQKDQKELYESIKVKCVDPDGNFFSVQFNLVDSLHKSYFQKRARPMDEIIPELSNYSVRHIRKDLEGFIITSKKDSLPFRLKINFEDSAADRESFIRSGKNTIVARQLANPAIYRKRKAVKRISNYAGFELFNNRKLIAAAYRKEKSEGIAYHFWIDSESETATKQISTALIFLIVGFAQ